jgi:hypothetical protein
MLLVTDAAPYMKNIAARLSVSYNKCLLCVKYMLSTGSARTFTLSKCGEVGGHKKKNLCENTS